MRQRDGSANCLTVGHYGVPYHGCAHCGAKAIRNWPPIPPPAKAIRDAIDPWLIGMRLFSTHAEPVSWLFHRILSACWIRNCGKIAKTSGSLDDHIRFTRRCP